MHALVELTFGRLTLVNQTAACVWLVILCWELGVCVHMVLDDTNHATMCMLSLMLVLSWCLTDLRASFDTPV